LLGSALHTCAVDVSGLVPTFLSNYGAISVPSDQRALLGSAPKRTNYADLFSFNVNVSAATLNISWSGNGAPPWDQLQVGLVVVLFAPASSETTQSTNGKQKI